MTDECIKLILEQCEAVRNEFRDMRAQMRDGFEDTKTRLSQLERGQALLVSHIAHLADGDAGMQVRLDGVDKRLERIERRLDLVDAED